MYLIYPLSALPFSIFIFQLLYILYHQLYVYIYYTHSHTLTLKHIKILSYKYIQIHILTHTYIHIPIYILDILTHTHTYLHSYIYKYYHLILSCQILLFINIYIHTYIHITTTTYLSNTPTKSWYQNRFKIIIWLNIHTLSIYIPYHNVCAIRAYISLTTAQLLANIVSLLFILLQFNKSPNIQDK